MEVQVAARWRKSSYSGNGGGTCVEVGEARRGVLVRDTQDRTGPALRFGPAAWRRFAGQVKRSLASGPRCRAGPPRYLQASTGWKLGAVLARAERKRVVLCTRSSVAVVIAPSVVIGAWVPFVVFAVPVWSPAAGRK